MKPATMKVERIRLSSIYVQKNISNRDEKKTEDSLEFLHLRESVRKTAGGLIHFITVREDRNGKYELFVGYRRFLVYKSLMRCGEKGYGTIIASVWSPETTDEEMLLKTIAENHVRSNLSSIESLESKIAMVPFFLGCGVHGEVEKNKKMGYKILKSYNSFLRSDNSKTDYAESIKKLTGCEDSFNQLNVFFDGIGETVRTFYEKTSVLMNASPEVLYLLHANKISLRNAKSLRAMKSDTDRLSLIRRALKYISSKELEELIRESNIMNSPLKRRDSLVKYTKDISVIMGSQKKDLTESEYEKIKAHLQEVEETILGKR